MIVGRSVNFSDPDPVAEGQTNPIRRDVFQIPGGQSITLRVVADNPGTWFLHCKFYSILFLYKNYLFSKIMVLFFLVVVTFTGHIEWHLEVGLAMQFIEAPLVAQQRNEIPQRIFDNCKALNQLSSGNAAGHQDPNDLTGLPQGPFIKNS